MPRRTATRAAVFMPGARPPACRIATRLISPVGSVTHGDKVIAFPSGMEHMGPVLQKLYDTLRGIQLGTVEAPEGWIRKIC